METATTGIVYGIRLESGSEYRYVGITTKTASRRFHQHLRLAKVGRKTPFYDWLRKHENEGLAVDILERVSSLAELGQAEVAWISKLRGQGQRLLNISEGGLGPTGVQWTEEMREAARIRGLGRKGVSRQGASNPFYGKKHSTEQRVKWSHDRKGTNQGVSNPNYGKYGSDHPSFGHVVSEEARKVLSDSRQGAGNPNFGKAATLETREKMSAARKGRPQPSSKRSAHTRHHTNKGVSNPNCKYCLEVIDARDLF